MPVEMPGKCKDCQSSIDQQQRTTTLSWQVWCSRQGQTMPKGACCEDFEPRPAPVEPVTVEELIAYLQEDQMQWPTGGPWQLNERRLIEKRDELLARHEASKGGHNARD